MRQIPDRPKIRVQVKLLAKRYVDARKAAAYWRCHRALESDASSFDRFRQFLGNVLTQLLIGFGAHCKRFPCKLHSGRFEDAHRCFGDFGTDAISGDESYFMSHYVIPSWRAVGSDRGKLYGVFTFTRSFNSFMNSLMSLKSRYTEAKRT